MDKLLPSLLILVSLSINAQNIDKIDNPVDFVNPLMGTMSDYELSTGNTYPAVGVPWGMNLWTPQTGKNGDGWQYKYIDKRIRGFKQTHQPSPWMNDHGVFSVMPTTGDAGVGQEERESWFSHRTEDAKPYRYKVFLGDYDVWAEMTATTRAAQFRFTYPKTDTAAVVIDAYHDGSYIKVIPEEQKVIGYSTKNSGGVADNFKNYFVLYFDRPFESAQVWDDDELVADTLEYKADHVGAVVRFKTQRGDQVHVKTASSYISFEQAERNLKQEIGEDTFDETEAKTRNRWNEELGKVEAEGGSIDEMRTFYSSLYRMLFFPLKMYEKDEDGEIFHYSPYTGEVLPGYLFAGTGFWDTFRALYPFLTLMYPDINVEMQKGLVNAYKEGGYLPEWSSPGFRDVMVGNNSASVVAGAYIKGLRGYDIETLFEALKKGANEEGPIGAVARKGADYYNELGYVPYDVGINENAARSLEYAYDDYAIYALGKVLEKPESEIGMYAEKSQNYRKLFDPSHNLMRGKNKDGSFQAPFNPLKWGDAFTEGNSWHYTWSVFHDVQGLIDLMGNKETFTQMLDSVFVMPPKFDDSYYGQVIHEIREMQVAGMGQYAHGNQPIQHMIYLYDYAGQPWKTQYWARETMNRMYAATPDGYIGDEDNGQTSAWYVFSAMGFYSVNPASTQYALGTPLFKRIKLHLNNGNTFVIEAPDNNAENRYANKVKLNGEVYHKNYIDHFDILDGGELYFEMTAEPNKNRGTHEDAAPFSFSKEN